MTQSHRPYTIGDDQYALGNILYRMMRGSDENYNKYLPTPGVCGEAQCDCTHTVLCPVAGCVIIEAQANADCDCIYGNCPHVRQGACSHTAEHIANTEPCLHACKFRGTRPVNVDDALRVLPYSSALRRAVRTLLSYNGVRPPRDTKSVLLSVEEEYRWWRENTEDGEDYVDVDDDVERRFRLLTLQKMEEDRMKELMEPRVISV